MNDSVRIAPPPGYGALVALDRTKHRGLAPRNPLPFGGKLNALYITGTEFPLAARYYPIVFVKDSGRDAYVSMVVTALTAGENLFVDESGQWVRDVYVPAYARRYPFCVAQVLDDGGEPRQNLICVDEGALERSDKPLIDARGEPTDAWHAIDRFLTEMEGARLHTERLCRALEDLDLLEPFEAQAFVNDGGKFHLKNMYRVTEERLRKLSGDVLEELVANSDLGRVYAHLLSLDNFKFLVDRAATRRAAA